MRARDSAASRLSSTHRMRIGSGAIAGISRTPKILGRIEATAVPSDGKPPAVAPAAADRTTVRIEWSGCPAGRRRETVARSEFGKGSLQSGIGGEGRRQRLGGPLVGRPVDRPALLSKFPLEVGQVVHVVPRLGRGGRR